MYHALSFLTWIEMPVLGLVWLGHFFGRLRLAWEISAWTHHHWKWFRRISRIHLIISRNLKTLLSFTVLYSSFYLAFPCINNMNCILSAYSSFLQNQIIFFAVKNLGNKENHLNQVFAIICNFYYGKIGLSLGYNL